MWGLTGDDSQSNSLIGIVQFIAEILFLDLVYGQESPVQLARSRRSWPQLQLGIDEMMLKTLPSAPGLALSIALLSRTPIQQPPRALAPRTRLLIAGSQDTCPCTCGSCARGGSRGIQYLRGTSRGSLCTPFGQSWAALKKMQGLHFPSSTCAMDPTDEGSPFSHSGTSRIQ